MSQGTQDGGPVDEFANRHPQVDQPDWPKIGVLTEMSDAEAPTPLKVRRRERQELALYEGVPEHLRVRLAHWLGERGAYDLSNFALRLRVPWDRPETLDDPRSIGVRFVTACLSRPSGADLVLDAIEMLVNELWLRAEASHQPDDPFPTHEDLDHSFAATELEGLLELGGSMWQLNAERNALEARVAEPVRELVNLAIESASSSPSPSSAEHLANAWSAVYGRSPNASVAYSEAIKAVESAAAPVVTPNDSVATLGKINGAIRAQPSAWGFAIRPGSAEPALILMEALWKGQTDRHGGIAATVPVTMQSAQASVHLAATLVQWFVTGAIKRR